MSDTARTEAQNIEVMRRGYEAFAKGDIETLKTLFSPHANWNQAEAGVLPGNYRGVQAILEFFGQLAHETEGSLRVDVLAMAASGDHVLVMSNGGFGGLHDKLLAELRARGGPA